MPKPEPIYRVLAVEGQMVPHPGSVGKGAMHIIGHSKSVSDDPADVRFPLGQPVAGLKFTHTSESEMLRETGDGFVARKIQDGDLDYLETVDSFEALLGSGVIEKRFADITAKHRAARGAEPLPALLAPPPIPPPAPESEPPPSADDFDAT